MSYFEVNEAVVQRVEDRGEYWVAFHISISVKHGGFSTSQVRVNLPGNRRAERFYARFSGQDNIDAGMIYQVRDLQESLQLVEMAKSREALSIDGLETICQDGGLANKNLAEELTAKSFELLDKCRALKP